MSFSRTSVVRLKNNLRFSGDRLSSSVATAIPVDLHYDQLIPANGNRNDGPLVILHGLFGSRRNWSSLSKALFRDLNRPIYTLDLRNHGSSPHATPLTYLHMAADVLHFCRSQSLSNISLLGHSMGGKVAMTLALSAELPANMLSNLIIADISPARGDLSPEFVSYVKGMKEIQDGNIATRKEAQKVLATYEKDPGIRDFLLTNFVQASPSAQSKFRVPLDIIGDAIPELGSFPYGPGERVWGGRTLFIKGTKSRYINHHNIPLAKMLFPNMALEMLDTGHWLHAERPTEFMKLVVDFTQSPTSNEILHNTTK